MKTPASKVKHAHLQAGDLRAAAQLAVQATQGVTRIVEGVHQAVWRTLGAPGGASAGQARGITGLVYRSVQGTAGVVGKSVDAALAALEPLLRSADAEAPGSPQREAVLAALNGVMGDRLAAGGNALATPMTLRRQGAASGRVLLLMHGLCMNDLQWHTPHGNHIDALVALGYTPLYLRYNTGLHTSQNGRLLSSQLEACLAEWPVPIESLAVVAHSMGGLVMRSATQIAAQGGAQWLRHLQHIAFLGTPHHGAPLERAGHWVDAALGSTPWSAPFTLLAQLRSAGITDLRHGHVQDEDWQSGNRFARATLVRRSLPLPANVACHTVAAALAPQRGRLAERLVGDGLVPLHSALGRHDEAQHTLRFAKTSEAVIYRTGHLALLHSPAVTERLVEWLKPH
jgi:PGAP1-like protein